MCRPSGFDASRPVVRAARAAAAAVYSKDNACGGRPSWTFRRRTDENRSKASIFAPQQMRSMRPSSLLSSGLKLGDPHGLLRSRVATPRRENDRASTVGHQNTQGPLPIYPPLLGGSTTAIVRRCAHGLPRALQGLPPSHARRPLRAVGTVTYREGATAGTTHRLP